MKGSRFNSWNLNFSNANSNIHLFSFLKAFIGQSFCRFSMNLTWVNLVIVLKLVNRYSCPVVQLLNNLIIGKQFARWSPHLYFSAGDKCFLLSLFHIGFSQELLNYNEMNNLAEFSTGFAKSYFLIELNFKTTDFF